MVRNITKGGATQIVKIHIGDKSKKGEEPKKKRTYKRKPKRPMAPSGTGNMPWTGAPMLGQAPQPAFSRLGWAIEPLQIRRQEEPAIQRIEHNPQMNIIYPPRQMRDYVAQMLEQSNANYPRIEEVPEAPEMQRRIEAPPKPVEEPEQPLVKALPEAEVPVSVEKRKKPKPPVGQLPEPAYAEINLIDEEEEPTRTRTVQELQELRDSGVITAEWLGKFNAKKAKEGNMTLLNVASKLGIPIPRTIQASKQSTINHILNNLK